MDSRFELLQPRSWVAVLLPQACSVSDDFLLLAHSLPGWLVVSMWFFMFQAGDGSPAHA